MVEIDRYSTGYRPQAAARLMAYTGLAAYEAAIPGMPDYKSLEFQFTSLSLPKADTNQEYYWPISVNAAYARILKNFYPHINTEFTDKIIGLENQLEKKGEEIKELKDQLQRLAAEFDNYKKRTVKEKERLYASSVADVAAAFIPVVDNIELALKASESGENGIRDGVQLICRQIEDVLANLKVKPIETIGEEFNPELHEAVMHVEDDSFGDNELIEEFRKGYIYKDEIVIRHSVVKVAN